MGAYRNGHYMYLLNQKTYTNDIISVMCNLHKKSSILIFLLASFLFKLNTNISTLAMSAWSLLVTWAYVNVLPYSSAWSASIKLGFTVIVIITTITLLLLYATPTSHHTTYLFHTQNQALASLLPLQLSLVGKTHSRSHSAQLMALEPNLQPATPYSKNINHYYYYRHVPTLVRAVLLFLKNDQSRINVLRD
jgi:hypothetical protein